MTSAFSATIAFLQLFLLVLWEGVGVFYFEWSPLGIFLVWGVGIWTLNVATASVLHTFVKLTTTPEAAAPVETAGITEADVG